MHITMTLSHRAALIFIAKKLNWTYERALEFAESQEELEVIQKIPGIVNELCDLTGEPEFGKLIEPRHQLVYFRDNGGKVGDLE